MSNQKQMTNDVPAAAGKDELLPCPWCGKRPEVTKHFKHEMYGLVHRCAVMPSIVMELRLSV